MRLSATCTHTPQRQNSLRLAAATCQLWPWSCGGLAGCQSGVQPPRNCHLRQRADGRTPTTGGAPLWTWGCMCRRGRCRPCRQRCRAGHPVPAWQPPQIGGQRDVAGAACCNKRINMLCTLHVAGSRCTCMPHADGARSRQARHGRVNAACRQCTALCVCPKTTQLQRLSY
jgi:hypothetical protein